MSAGGRSLYAGTAAALAYYYFYLRNQTARPLPLSTAAAASKSTSNSTVKPSQLISPPFSKAAVVDGFRSWKLLALGSAVLLLYHLLKRRKIVSPEVAHLSSHDDDEKTPREPMAPPSAPSDVHVLHSGGFGEDVAAMISSKITKLSPASVCNVHEMNHFRTWAEQHALTERTTPLVAIFVVSTIENEQPTETAGPCVRYFNRRSHADTLLSGKLAYAVLGLGDSNLLLDRQTTTAEDCNQVATRLDARLCALGAMRYHACGMTDDRTGNRELEPWIASLGQALYPPAP